MEIPVNYLAVVVAAVAGFLLSWGWYAVLNALWVKKHGRSGEKTKPELVPYLIAAVCYLLMAWMLAGLMGHLANVTVRGGVTAAFFVWAGFVLTSTVVNQVFRGIRPVAISIDVGNWLAVLLLMGAIIGAFGV